MADSDDAALARVRDALVCADSELSAQGHHRPQSPKEELLAISWKCRSAYEEDLPTLAAKDAEIAALREKLETQHHRAVDGLLKVGGEVARLAALVDEARGVLELFCNHYAISADHYRAAAALLAKLAPPAALDAGGKETP